MYLLEKGKLKFYNNSFEENNERVIINFTKKNIKIKKSKSLLMTYINLELNLVICSKDVTLSI